MCLPGCPRLTKSKRSCTTESCVRVVQHHARQLWAWHHVYVVRLLVCTDKYRQGFCGRHMLMIDLGKMVATVRR